MAKAIKKEPETSTHHNPEEVKNYICRATAVCAVEVTVEAKEHSEAVNNAARLGGWKVLQESIKLLHAGQEVTGAPISAEEEGQRNG